MTCISLFRISPTRKTVVTGLTLASALLLVSCQTSADEIMSLGDAGATEGAAASPTAAGKAYRDPLVAAVSGPDATAKAQLPLTEPSSTGLKRKSMPMAAAYSEIAEPPPEVLALQQQQPGAAQSSAANLAELTMQPTQVNAGSNSLFSAGRAVAPAPLPESPTGAQPVVAATTANGSLVPGDMPTLGVNAVRKSLFSPSPEQMALQQQQEMNASPESLPLTEPATASAAVAADTDPPVLRKLSDPRPKRKILALREPEPVMPDRIQLTPEQLQQMGAVEDTSAASPASEPDPAYADAAPATAKKKWLPSLSELLSGGKNKAGQRQTEPKP